MSEPLPLEADSRFPSGKWVGFFIQKELLGKHQMELLLTFSQGTMTGEGRDLIGEFIIRGHYQVEDGKCRWTKRYLARHDVFYNGFNEGKGIWGSWEIPAKANNGIRLHGGFHIWPQEFGDLTGSVLKEEEEVPAEGEIVAV